MCLAITRPALMRPGLLLTALALVACGSGAEGAAGADGGGGGLSVVASFYPLAFAAQRVGGDRVTVSNLTPAGAEPHDLELTPGDLVDLQQADAVVYLAGFSAAVDDAVDAEVGDRAFEVGRLADLDLTYTPIEEGVVGGGATVDPHFWLDPTRLAAVSDALAAHFTKLDPDGAAMFAANAAALRRDLAELDGELRSGLASCENRTIVTSHNAFGYLAERYGLVQLGITGLTPEEEPTPAQLAVVTRFVEDHHVRTIYYETLVSPAIAETVAAETGASTAVLDPLEGLSEASRGGSYLDVMRSNLKALRAGQGCS